LITTEIKPMPILHLDSVSTKGITCTSCKGELKTTERKSMAAKILTTVTLGQIKAKFYACKKCRKQYV